MRVEKSTQYLLFTNYYEDDEIKEGVVGMAYTTHEGD
jgi:hypothetical protein